MNLMIFCAKNYNRRGKTIATLKVFFITCFCLWAVSIASLLGNYLSKTASKVKPYSSVSKLSLAMKMLFSYTVKRAVSGFFLDSDTARGSEKVTCIFSSFSVRDAIFQLYSILPSFSRASIS